jgi:hypothetical protein
VTTAAAPLSTPADTAFAVEQKKHLVKTLRRFDMVFFTVAVIVRLDLIGQAASNGFEALTWTVVLVVLFLIPYCLVTAEVGSAFTAEGGPYEWVKLTMGRADHDRAAAHRRLERLGAAGRDQLAVVDDRDPLTVLGLVHVMRGQEHRDVLARAQLVDVAPDVAAGLRIRPTVGSSRNSTCGECIRPRAISRRRFIPPENVRTRPCRRCESSTISSTSSSRLWICDLGDPVQLGVEPQVLLRGQVIIERRVLEHQPDPPANGERIPRDVEPATRALPELGRSSVHKIEIIVDLPAPFGPRKPNASLGATVKLTPRMASTSSKRLTRPSTATTGSG